VQRVIVVGILLQDLLVEPLRTGEPALLVECDGLL
jgi:hypothetical protein